jgi:hypothetical protein
MSQPAATIASLPVAFEVVKAMHADGLEWSEGFRPLGRQAIAEIIEQQMAQAIDGYLDQFEADDRADRRNKVKKADQPAVKRALHKVMNAPNAPAARTAARKVANRFEDKYPAAIACLRHDLDELLTCFRYRSEEQRRKIRTTNAIERRFREVRRRTRPMGTFQDKTSMDRILFAVFTHENKSQGVSTPFLLTHNN